MNEITINRGSAPQPDGLVARAAFPVLGEMWRAGAIKLT